MNKIFIHYFSGTGNSFHAAKQLANKLTELGFIITFHSIEEGKPSISDDVMLHIFLFPVYATSVPHIMRKYIRQLPNGKSTNSVVISTNGRINTKFRDGYEGWALYQARLYLKFKNYNVFYSDTLDYPHNVTAVIPPLKESTAQFFLNNALQKCNEIAQNIADTTKHHKKIFLPNIIWCIPFGILYSVFGRRFLGKLFAANSNCNNCGLCVKKCPTNVICKGKNNIRWKWNCEGCLRCLNTCPNKAIDISLFRIVTLVLVSFFNINFLLPDKLINDFVSLTIHTVLPIVVYLFIIYVLDWLIYLISGILIIRKIASWGFTRLFGRYNIK